MKKLLSILTALAITFGACACGKKDQVTETKQEQPNLPKNEVADVAKKAEEITVENTKNVKEIEQKVADLKNLVEEKASEIKNESEAIYQNRQVAVAIMEEALNDIKTASEEKDEEKMEQATNMFKIAQSLWDYDDTKESK